ncbi:MAG: protein kinase [Polyangiaceae bacterium]
MSGEPSAQKPTQSAKNPADLGPDEPAEVLPRRFGRLTLLRLLARGGMGEVYLAATGAIEGAERPSVVKIIRREHAGDRSFLARFLDEARIQAQLHHPGVAQILEASTDESGQPFVVVEHVEGRNLGEVRNRAQQLGARITWPEALAVGMMLGEALAHVHERTDAAGRPLEIVHRDLSPQNVMLGYGGDLKLIDFGTARGENRRCHTVAGIVFAKPGYVAPEVANNTPGGVPADLYAYGVMFWEILAGRRFLTGEAAEHMAAVGSGKRCPSAIAQACDAPPELDAIITRLTATKIEDRYASAREALSDMAELMKRAPSLSNGERSVRSRISQLMQRLYPAEPARSRAEFARLVAHARKVAKPRLVLPPPSPTPPPADGDPTLLPGTRYRLLREVGRGAMAVVHEACHVDLGRRFALKVLPAEQSSFAASEQLRAEARAIARIEHENLVRLVDFGVAADGRAFYAMEFLEGETLEQRLGSADTFDWREVARLGIQACRALEAAHASGVVHRDIKPANLFLTSGGCLKLLDFGVAKLARDVRSEPTDGEALVLSGTPEYMAPEQTRGGEADDRSDIYALGGVLYELATGRLPFDASSAIQLLDEKSKRPPEPARVRAPQRGIPTMLDQTISKAMDPNPSERFQSAEAMREALEEALREPEIRRRRRRRIGLGIVGAFVIALGVVGGVAAAKPDVRNRAVAAVSPLVQRLKGAPAAAEAAPPADPAATEASAAEAPPAEEQAAAGETGEGDDTAGDPAGEPGDKAEGRGEKPEGATAQVGEADEDESGETGDRAEPEADKPADKAKADAPAEKPAEKVADKKAGASDDSMFNAEPVKAESGDKVEALLAKAAEYRQAGKKVKALNEYRKIGKKNRKDARALKAWSEAAAQMKGYGEALRVAQRWANLDKSVEARLFLSNMQRKVGKREAAIKTLNALLQERPGCEEARSMLKTLSPEPRVAQR